ncbi:MAG: alkaline phosphatase family protein [Verrucomicrobiota bacterium]
MATDRLFPVRGRTGNGHLRHACRLLAVLGTFGGAHLLTAAEPKHVVLVVWDGMRPDFATEQYAPTLARLARAGVRFRNHHSVYATATDVNGAALATGRDPQEDGIFANSEYHPAINPRQPVDTGDPETIRRGDEVSGGKYLTAPTLGEILHQAGKKGVYAGTKSVALLFDRKNAWTVVPMKGKPLTVFAGAPLPPAARDEMTKRLGPFVDDPSAPAAERNRFTTRALTDYLWRDGITDFSLLWLSEPDLAEHNFSPGSPEALAAIKSADDNLAALLAALDEKGARASTDVLVVSDHGFSTIRRSIDVVALLTQAGFHAGKEFSDKPTHGDILVVGNGGTLLFYVRDHDPAATDRLVSWLQHRDFTGVLFTRSKMEGTFPLRTAQIDLPDAPDVVMAFRWADEKNRFGVPGLIDADWNRKPGQGTHATLSPFDVHNLFIAAGPDFKAGFEDVAPTSNKDIMPAILSLLHLPCFSVHFEEALRLSKTDAPAKIDRTTMSATRQWEDGQWRQELTFSHSDRGAYLDEGNGSFTAK